MAEKLNTTRRAVLSGLAALPLASVPVLAAPAPHITLAQAIAALRDLLDEAVQPGNGWSLTLGMTADGTCHEAIVELAADGQSRAIPGPEAWA